MRDETIKVMDITQGSKCMALGQSFNDERKHFDHYCEEFKEAFIPLLEKYGIKDLWISKCEDDECKDPMLTKRECFSSYYIKWDTDNFRLPKDGLILSRMLREIILEGDEDRVAGLLTVMSEKQGFTFETYGLNRSDYTQLYKDGVWIYD